MREQLLDSMDLERERGITIKAQAVRVLWKGHELNLIDTPGHVDFTYEVSRSLQACEGALLVVDAAQGIEAQTLANAYLAIENDLEIVPVVNKIDLPQADPDGAAAEVAELIGDDPERVLRISAKTGAGRRGGARRDRRAHPGAGRRPGRAAARADLRLVVRPVPRAWSPSSASSTAPSDRASRCGRWRRHALRGRGARLHVAAERTPVERARRRRGRLRRHRAQGRLAAPRRRHAHDRRATRPPSPLPGYKDVKPMVFAGLFPTDSDDYPELRDALERLKLNDAALFYEPETSQALGFGFRCGFLGLLHMEIVRERLEREFDLDLLVTAPNVAYRVERRTGEMVEVHNPPRCRASSSDVEEPYISASIIVPKEYVGAVMELCNERRGPLRPHGVPVARSACSSPTSCRSARSCSTSTTS